MARFDIYTNPHGDGYLPDVQTNILLSLNTRIVVPLMPQSDAPIPAKRLNPVFDIDKIPYVMVTQFMAAVPKSILKKPIFTLAEKDTEITNALDMVFSGF